MEQNDTTIVQAAEPALKNKPVVSMSANALWNMAATAFSMVALFCLTPYLVQHLGEENYGIFLFLATFIGVLGLSNLGVGEATLRYVAFHASRHDDIGINRVFGASLFVAAVSGGIAALLAIALGPWLVGALKFSSLKAGQGAFLLQLTAISFWLRLVAGSFLSIPQALLRYDLYSKLLVAETAVRTLGSFAVVMLGWGLNGLVALTLAISGFLLIAAIILARHLIPHLAFCKWPSRAGFHEVFGYGMYAFASQLIGIAWQYADRVLLGVLVSASAIAYFSVPQDLASRLLMLLAGAPVAVLMPKFAAITDPTHLRRTYLQSVSIFLCVSIVIFVPATVFIRDFLSLWISPEFASKSGFIAILLCGSTMIRGAFLPHEALFRGIGRPNYLLVLTTASALTVLTVDLLLIPRIGLLGAGYALCISPIWGIAAVVFALGSVLGGVTILEVLRTLFAPVALGFFSLGVGFLGRGLLPEQLSWPTLLLSSGALLVSTGLLLALYELTVCRRNSDFVFVRRLARLVPNCFSSCANAA